MNIPQKTIIRRNLYRGYSYHTTVNGYKFCALYDNGFGMLLSTISENDVLVNTVYELLKGMEAIAPLETWEGVYSKLA